MRLRHLALFTCLVSLATAKPALELHVALDGKAGNPGTIEAPLTFGAAIDEARDFLSKPNRPKTGGLEIIISAGRYPVTKAYRLGPEFQGSKDFPITIRAAKGDEVLFDGQAGIEDLSAFKPVTDESERARLAESARDQVLVQKVTSDALHHNLARRVSASINIDGQPWVASAYPNEGYAFLDPKPAIPEVCPPGIPKKDQAYRVRAGKPPHQEPGKPRGWLGSMKEPRGAHARILDRSPARAGSWQQWQDEIARLTGRQEFMGFYEAVWKESRMPIKAVDAEKQTIHLPLVFSYGFGWLNDQPFRVFGLLCEVDQPGEWHYDPSSRKLYLIPPKPLDQIKSIGAPVAQGFLDLDRTRHVSIHGITVQNIAGGSVIRLINGSHNLVAGCTFRSSLARGIEVGGTHNRVLGCDFIDLHGHINLSGGRRSVTEITPGHNLVENCHFYHKRFTQTKVRVAIGGVGNTFRRNLVHNSIGQAVTVSGNDHLLELNELFNIGYEEGDGAAIYSGADLAGYGNVYRHNFLHHLIRTPDKRLGRAGIMLDDHQAGGTIEGNVFFKSCTAAVQINCGAGNIVRNNVFLEGDQGIMTLGNWGPKSFEITEAIAADPKHGYRGEKEDYIGRTERTVGPKGWTKEPWKSKYPLFHKVMSDTGETGRMWPVYSRYENNLYHGNRHNKAYIKGYTDALKKKLPIVGSREVGKDLFADYDKMDFTLAPVPEGLEPIPFAEIGLYRNEHRPAVPDQVAYRQAIREFYRDQPSYRAWKKQFDSASLIESLTR